MQILWYMIETRSVTQKYIKWERVIGLNRKYAANSIYYIKFKIQDGRSSHQQFNYPLTFYLINKFINTYRVINIFSQYLIAGVVKPKVFWIFWYINNYLFVFCKLSTWQISRKMKSHFMHGRYQDGEPTEACSETAIRPTHIY